MAAQRRGETGVGCDPFPGAERPACAVVGEGGADDDQIPVRVGRL